VLAFVEPVAEFAIEPVAQPVCVPGDEEVPRGFPLGEAGLVRRLVILAGRPRWPRDHASGEMEAVPGS
jgi:hypothetical protein